LLGAIAALTDHRRTIVAGDFNSPSPLDGPAPFVYSTTRFLNRGYVDAYGAFQLPPREYTKLAGNNAGKRIDHFFVSRDLMPAVVGAGVETGTRFPEHSDHRPVWLELELARLAKE
jgi:endonuclease/exonuclease/phosphatase family metal-dependent hydrolase